MSYINKALQKAREEKKIPYATYEPTVSVPRETGKKSKTFFAFLIVAVVVWIAGVFIFWYGPAQKKAPAAAPKQPMSRPEVAVTESPVTQTIAPEVTQKDIAAAREPGPVEVKPDREKDDPQTLYAQALKHHRQGDLRKAKELYKKVIRLEPRNIEALNNLGVVYMNLNVHQWAIIRLHDALKIKPNYADALYNLACIYAREHDAAKSVGYLKKAIGCNPDVRKWVKEDKDLQALADLPEFRKLMENNEKR
mgnify:FL=1